MGAGVAHAAVDLGAPDLLVELLSLFLHAAAVHLQYYYTLFTIKPA